MKVLGKTDTELLLNTFMNYVFSKLQRTTLPFKNKPQPISLKAVVGPTPVLVCLFTGWLCYMSRQKGYCQDSNKGNQTACCSASIFTNIAKIKFRNGNGELCIFLPTGIYAHVGR